METKTPNDSRAVNSIIVLPGHTNHHGTLFGGELMAMIDNIASISATRHARNPVVTASVDSVDFLNPVRLGDSICLESFVTWAGTTSMEVFVRATTETLLTGERKVCATCFLTFVAIGNDGKPTHVPQIQSETESEKRLFDGAPARMEVRKVNRQLSKSLAQEFGTIKVWDKNR